MAEQAQQDEEFLHDHVAEHHMEQQLFVGPARPVRRRSPLSITGGAEQVVKIGARPLEICRQGVAVGVRL
ncbi:hypothetical protein KHQ06_01095 [Nocardia tengchongensis]|uniref:Uncharacterized protein n=1 Tax=Nocardia tengchongensis TaxID=2055889 RepID=A0ABX8CQQ4_9NOCA|nr:hypothetical protein KHQ06_01095 [Nocardia tengchongensis]